MNEIDLEGLETGWQGVAGVPMVLMSLIEMQFGYEMLAGRPIKATFNSLTALTPVISKLGPICWA